MDPVNHRIVEVDKRGKQLRQWAGIDELASDLAYDSTNGRLVYIVNEPSGILGQIDLTTGQREAVTLGRPVARLIDGAKVFEVGAPNQGSAFDMTQIPYPLTPYPPSGEHQLTFDDTGSVEFSSLRNGAIQQIDRPGFWTLQIHFAGRNGPARPVAWLIQDASIVDDTLFLGLKVGSYSRAPGWTNKLVMLAVDLASGGLRFHQTVAECGLEQDANQVSRLTANESGEMLQLCVGPRRVELRFAPTNK